MPRALGLLIALLCAAMLLYPAVDAWAAPLPRNGAPGPGGLSMGDWKSIATTVLLAVGLVQFAGQAVARGWIQARTGSRRFWARLHRPGGIVAFLLAWLIFALCLYAMYGPEEIGAGILLALPRVLLHAILGGGLLLVLLAKAIVSNFARKQLRLNVPLGIAAGILTLGVWLTSALPHLLHWEW